MRSVPLVAVLIASLALVGCASQSATLQSSSTPSAAAARLQAVSHNAGQVRALVVLFGSRQQEVWLRSPQVRSQLRSEYRRLVTTSLLHSWLADPAAGPGRAVSSPWPDHITIVAVAFHGASTCTVTGRLVELTSAYVPSGAEDAGTPVTVQLRCLRGGRWVISAYAQGQ